MVARGGIEPSTLGSGGIAGLHLWLRRWSRAGRLFGRSPTQNDRRRGDHREGKVPLFANRAITERLGGHYEIARWRVSGNIWEFKHYVEGSGMNANTFEAGCRIVNR